MSQTTTYPRCRNCGTSNPSKTINCVKCGNPLFGRCPKCGSAVDHTGHCSPCRIKTIEAVAGVVAAPFKFAWNAVSFLASLFFFLLFAGWLFSVFGGVGVAVLIGAAVIAIVIYLSNNK